MGSARAAERIEPNNTQTEARTPRDRGVAILIIVAFALPLAYFLVCLQWPAKINSDSCIGFLTWDSMAKGGPWNCWVFADSANLAKDMPSFTTWWSPGQYLFAGLFERLGMSLGTATNVTTLLSEWIGLAGLVVLFQELGFDRTIRSVSVALIAAGWAASSPFNTYMGGDIVSFAFFPWAFWVMLVARGNLAVLTPVLVGLFLVGAYLKLALMVVALGMLAFCYVDACGWKLPTGFPALKVGVALAFSFVLFYAILWATFLRWGPTPNASGEASFGFSLSVGFAFCGTFFSTFSISPFLHRLLLFPSHPVFADVRQIGPWLWLLVPFAAYAYALGLRQAPNSTYRNLITALLIAFFGTFATFYLEGRAIGFSDRYFRPAGFLLVPALIRTFRNEGRPAKVFVGVLFIFSTAYGLLGFGQRTLGLSSQGHVGDRGFTQTNITAGALRAIDRIDATLHDPQAVVYVPSPEHALELPHLRILPGLGAFPSVEELKAAAYRGRPSALIVVVPATLARDGLSELLLGAFRDVPKGNWRHESVDSWDIYYDRAALEPLIRAAVHPSGDSGPSGRP